LDSSCSTDTGATAKEYIEVLKLETQLKSGEWCAKVETAGTGNYENNACTTKVAAKEFIKVLVPEFEHCVKQTGGKWMAGCKASGTEFEKVSVPSGSKITFTDKEGVSNFYATNSTGGAVVFTCTGDTSKGEITGPTTTAKVTVTFTGCTAKEEAKAACSANSKGEPAGTIKTNGLRDTLGTVAKAEATSEVGEALEPEGTEGFVTLEATCIAITKAQVSGSVIGEVKPINVMAAAGELIFECETPKSEKQKIQKFVGFPKDTLSDFANPACFESEAEITFAEPIEVAYP
jgi:hypothetical protein